MLNRRRRVVHETVSHQGGRGDPARHILAGLEAKATTWSAGCMAMRMTFSASEISLGLDIAGFDQAGHGVLGIEHAVPDQRLHGVEAAAAGDHARWSRNAGAGSIAVYVPDRSICRDVGPARTRCRRAEGTVMLMM